LFRGPLHLRPDGRRAHDAAVFLLDREHDVADEFRGPVGELSRDWIRAEINGNWRLPLLTVSVGVDGHER
jgi:hypothetical protein